MKQQIYNYAVVINEVDLSKDNFEQTIMQIMADCDGDTIILVVDDMDRYSKLGEIVEERARDDRYIRHLELNSKYAEEYGIDPDSIETLFDLSDGICSSSDYSIGIDKAIEIAKKLLSKYNISKK